MSINSHCNIMASFTVLLIFHIAKTRDAHSAMALVWLSGLSARITYLAWVQRAAVPSAQPPPPPRAPRDTEGGGGGQEGKNPTPCLAHTAGRQSRAAASYSCTWQPAGLNPSHPQQPAVDTAPLSTASLQPGCSTWLSKKATPASCTCSA